jgi:hypothetical protein
MGVAFIQGPYDVFLGLEMPVEGARGEPGLLQNVCDGRLLTPVAPQDVQGGCQNEVPFGVRLVETGSTR